MILKNFITIFLFLMGFATEAQSGMSFVHPEGKFVQVNGVRLWIEMVGKGDPLFMIAGGPGYSHLYMHSFDSLKDSNLLVFIDNFGRGKSDTAKDISQYNISREVEDVEGIRKALGYDKINLLGHSYGSVVVQEYALEYGIHVKHLIIADGLYNAKMWQEICDNSNHEFSENDPELWDSLMAIRSRGYRSSDKVHADLYNRFHSGFLYAYCPENFKHLPEDANYPNDFNTKLYYQFVGSDGDFYIGNEIVKFDVSLKLKDLKMPVLIITGRYDRVVVPKYSVLYKIYCPQAKFVMFEHSGHYPQLEEPEKEFALIRDFLK